MTVLRRACLVAAAIALSASGVAATPAAASPAPAVSAAAAPCSYSGSHPTLSYGSTGSAVKHAQCLLNYWALNGYVAQDGIFGSITKLNVELIQGACRIADDGIIGPNTWNCLHPDTYPNPY